MPAPKKSILCVHQGTERYGSDRSFASAVSAILDHDEYNATVLIPAEGEIVGLLSEHEIRTVSVRGLWILRKAGFLRAVTLGMPRNIINVMNAMRDIRTYDLVYVNTAVIVDFLLASIIIRKPLIVHVREIPVGAAMRVIRSLLIASRSKIIFNSKATCDAFSLPKTQQQVVVYNGFQISEVMNKDTYDGSRKLRLLCIGRLNGWKGQDVLIRACTLLPPHLKERIEVRIVGGVYENQNHFRQSLEATIAQNDLGAVVQLADFIPDPTAEYVFADIVVVPSILPEPFGRVAIEGMAHRCAIIASNHGGLTEIVQHGETGWLVAPADVAALAAAVIEAVENPTIVVARGDAGAARFHALFTQNASNAALLKAIG